MKTLKLINFSLLEVFLFLLCAILIATLGIFAVERQDIQLALDVKYVNNHFENMLSECEHKNPGEHCLIEASAKPVKQKVMAKSVPQPKHEVTGVIKEMPKTPDVVSCTPFGLKIKAFWEPERSVYSLPLGAVCR